MKRLLFAFLLCFTAYGQRTPRVVDSVASLIALTPSAAVPDVVVVFTNNNTRIQFRYYPTSSDSTNAASPYVYATSTGTGRWKEVRLTGDMTGVTVDGSSIDATTKLNITNGTAVNLTVDGAKPVTYVANVVAMQALTNLTSGQVVQTSGRTTAGIGGGRYLWTSGSTTTTNLGTVFANASGGNGRFTLLDQPPGDIRFWGAKPGVSTDSGPAIQAALDTLTSSTFDGGQKPEIFIPQGQWYVTTTLLVTNPVVIIGEGVEANSVNVTDYQLNGSVIVSAIASSIPVITVKGLDGGSGATYIQGIEIRDLGIDGKVGAESDGIWFDGNSNLSDVRLYNLVIRQVGGSGIKSGDSGSRTNSPRWGYSRLEKITVILPTRDGFELYCQNNSSVSVLFDSLYVNGAGRHSFNFVNFGFTAHNLVENNAGTLESGWGMRLQNCNESTITGLYLEGDGRYQESGDSIAPMFTAGALLLSGSTKTEIVTGHFTSPSGNISTPQTRGVVHITSSTAANGWSARDSSGNVFENPFFSAYVYGPSALSATAVGSGGSLGAGVYGYRTTWIYTNATYGQWETPLGASGLTTVRTVGSDSVTLTNFTAPTSLADSFVMRRIWRTTADGADFALLTTTTNGLSTYGLTDTTADGSLGTNSTPMPHIYIDTDCGQNIVRNAAFTKHPIITDLGSQNMIVGSRILDTDPSLQPFKQPVSFRGSTYETGQRRFAGADTTGIYPGNGVTRYQDKGVDWLMPGYSARAFGESSIAYLSSRATSTANTVTLGGNGTDIGATQVRLGYTGVSGTNVTVNLTSDSSGITVSAPQTNTAAAQFSSTLRADSTTSFGDHATLDNAKAIKGKDAGGTARALIAMSSGDIFEVGDSTKRINVYPGTSGLYLGNPGVTAPIYIAKQASATAGSVIKNSSALGFVASYWSNSVANDYVANVQYNMDATNAATLYLNLNGANLFGFKDTGAFYLPTGGTIEFGNSSDTTLARASAGVVSVEGNTLLGYTGTPSTGQIAVYTNSAWAVMTPGSSGIGGSTGSTDNRVLRADGTGGATVQNSAIRVSDVTAYSSQDYVQVSAIGSGTKTHLVLSPEGTGAIIGWIPPDGTGTGGNNRGNYAVDLGQHSNAAYVASGANSFGVGQDPQASGQYSVAMGIIAVASGQYSTAMGSSVTASSTGAFAQGFQATASGTVSAAIGYTVTSSGTASLATGQDTTASASHSSAGGYNSKAYLIGMDARASGTHAAQGDSQAIQLTWRNATSSTTPTELYLNGATATLRAAIPNNSVWSGRVILQGTTAAGAAVNSYAFDVVIKRGVNAAATTLKVATKTVVYEDDAGADSNLTADTTNGSLKVEVTAANATATRWSATGYFTETGFP